jgi:PAS domain S-box-containing protein
MTSKYASAGLTANGENGKDSPGTEAVDMVDTLLKLSESGDEFRPIFERSRIGMVLSRPDRSFIEINLALARVLGYAIWELQGKHLADLLNIGGDGSALSRSDQRLGSPRELATGEKHYRPRSGYPTWMQMTWVPIWQASGELGYLVGVLMEIKERHRAEEALKQSEDRYQRLFQGTSEGICMCSKSGNFLDANPAFCRMLGYQREEMLGLSVADVAADFKPVCHHFASVLVNGRDRLVTQMRHKDGSVVEVELSTSAIEWDGRQVLHGIVHHLAEGRR